jgi:hypothetical protein
VYVRLSGETFHSVARPGTIFPCGSKSVSPLKDIRGKCGHAVSRIGFMTPGSVWTMTRVPPGFGCPQPMTGLPAAASTTRPRTRKIVRRGFIDAMRFPSFDVVQ